MNNYVATFLLILLTVLLGATFVMGDSGSIKASISSMMTTTNSQITDLTK